MACSVQVCCVANDDAILTRNLKSSPDVVKRRVKLSVIWGAKAASVAYREAIEAAHADVVVFAHQDVYFPDGWFSKLEVVCERLSSVDPSWAVAGLCGMTTEGEFVGHIWDAGLGAVCGGPFRAPRSVTSLDEVVLMIRRASGIVFDPELPSFHLYGTDIVLEAHRAGMKSYVVDLPVIHNSKAGVRLDSTYIAAYRFMVRKWRALLPLPTVIVQLTGNPWPLLLRRLRLRYKAIFRASTLRSMVESPELVARQLGFAKAGEDCI